MRIINLGAILQFLTLRMLGVSRVHVIARFSPRVLHGSDWWIHITAKAVGGKQSASLFYPHSLSQESRQDFFSRIQDQASFICNRIKKNILERIGSYLKSIRVDVHFNINTESNKFTGNHGEKVYAELS